MDKELAYYLENRISYVRTLLITSFVLARNKDLDLKYILDSFEIKGVKTIQGMHVPPFPTYDYGLMHLFLTIGPDIALKNILKKLSCKEVNPGELYCLADIITVYEFCQA
jgi:hypothetical protein